MVVIRLARWGAKKRPFYRMVVADSRMSRDGRFIEQVGTYNPLTARGEVSLRLERIEHWLRQGARLSDTVNTLVRRERRLASGKSRSAS
ncbi:MAG: 30S ribosomal protein S16 [Myxococcota bacterium]